MKGSLKEKKEPRKPKYSKLSKAGSGYLYLFLAPAVILTFVFGYLPLFSNYIAFLDYDLNAGWFGLASPFVGFQNFDFIKEAWFWQLMLRTFIFSFVCLVTSFPASLALALMFNELRNVTFKKVTQTLSYIPNFVSWVTISGLVYIFLTVEPGGLLNDIREVFGLERISFMQDSKYFLPLLVITNIWKGVGWGTILYMAAISGIDQQIYEAAEIDGAGRFAKVLHITLPGLIPTFCIQLIFAMGGLVNSNFDQIFNLQNAVIREQVNTINLYTYYNGVVNMQYQHSTAVGLFQGVVSMILVLGTNKITRKLSNTGIF